MVAEAGILQEELEPRESKPALADVLVAVEPRSRSPFESLRWK